jgi:hypothetical protein
VLFGDGDTRTTTKAENHTSGLGLENPQAIHEALRSMEMQSKQTFHRKGSNSAREQGLGRATHEQVVDVANFIAKEIYSSTLARSIAWIPTKFSSQVKKCANSASRRVFAMGTLSKLAMKPL